MSGTAAPKPGQRDITLTAADGHALAATLFTPPAEMMARAPVLIAGATAVPRGYYARFARFLAARGHPVLTLDYRGVGGSLPGHVRRHGGRMADWGRQDLDAAIGWLRESHPDRRPLLVGHSVGGQILPLADQAGEVSAILLVASQSGAPRHWKGRARLRLAVFWYLLVPLLTRTLGHLPGWVMGSAPLPAGIARDWARWGRHRDYILGHMPGLRDRFRALDRPILSISFPDDFYAPRAAVQELLTWYGGTTKEHRLVHPRDLGVKAIGHFGFFRDQFADTLWRDAAGWLAERDTADRPPAAA